MLEGRHASGQAISGLRTGWNNLVMAIVMPEPGYQVHQKNERKGFQLGTARIWIPPWDGEVSALEESCHTKRDLPQRTLLGVKTAGRFIKLKTNSGLGKATLVLVTIQST